MVAEFTGPDNVMPATRLFDKALCDIKAGKTLFTPPQDFGAYAESAGFSSPRTASHISVDSIKKLSPELRQASAMVFRLGRSEKSQNTNFAIARTVTGWSDYFLIDKEVFGNLQPKAFVPTVPYSALYAFTLFPDLTETSLVNLALASGLLPYALDVDTTYEPSIPATGQGVYSFPVKPHSKLGAEWFHRSGQVEIDALFVARRHSKETLFLVEAKCSDQFDSLAKHKLYYAISAIRSHVPANVDICPIYLRVIRQPSLLTFWIAECSFSMPGAKIFSIDEIRSSNVVALSLIALNR